MICTRMLTEIGGSWFNMPLTLEELKERLAEQVDEQTLLELLNINSFQLVEAFSDLIEDKYDELNNQMEDEFFE